MLPTKGVAEVPAIWLSFNSTTICRASSSFCCRRSAIAGASSGSFGSEVQPSSPLIRVQRSLPALPATPLTHSVARTVTADVTVANVIGSTRSNLHLWNHITSRCRRPVAKRCSFRASRLDRGGILNRSAGQQPFPPRPSPAPTPARPGRSRRRTGNRGCRSSGE